jgi:hypothetical protein
MHVTAYFALLVALLVCLGGAVLALFGLWRREYDRLRLIEQGHMLVTFAVVLGSSILTVALWRRDFSFVYVSEYTDTLLPLFYALTAFWAGQAGSLLFWMLVLALFGLAFARTVTYRELSASTRHAYWLFFLATEALFLMLLTGPSNPFLEAVPPPAEGRGLNPLLRNPGMIFHPPLLFLGYAGFAVPACLGLASWLTGESRSFVAAPATPPSCPGFFSPPDHPRRGGRTWSWAGAATGPGTRSKTPRSFPGSWPRPICTRPWWNAGSGPCQDQRVPCGHHLSLLHPRHLSRAQRRGRIPARLWRGRRGRPLLLFMFYGLILLAAVLTAGALFSPAASARFPPR